MNNENKYYYINKLPKEYHRVIWDIMIIAESDMGLYMTLTKDKAKILMRYLYKITKYSDNWKKLRNYLEKERDSEIFEYLTIYNCILDKMNELEGDVIE